MEANYGEKCIENPKTKHSYINDYINIGSFGDLPDNEKWKELINQ